MISLSGLDTLRQASIENNVEKVHSTTKIMANSAELLTSGRELLQEIATELTESDTSLSTLNFINTEDNVDQTIVEQITGVKPDKDGVYKPDNVDTALVQQAADLFSNATDEVTKFVDMVTETLPTLKPASTRHHLKNTDVLFSPEEVTTYSELIESVVSELPKAEELVTNIQNGENYVKKITDKLSACNGLILSDRTPGYLRLYISEPDNANKVWTSKNITTTMEHLSPLLKNADKLRCIVSTITNNLEDGYSDVSNVPSKDGKPCINHEIMLANLCMGMLKESNVLRHNIARIAKLAGGQ